MDFSRLPVDTASLVFFDLETTGLYPTRGDGICEVGAIKVSGGKEVACFHSLLNPQQPMPPGSIRIHGITDAEVAGAPAFEEIAGELISFFSGSVLCGYNVAFDISFLQQALEKMQYPRIELPAIDILMMARSVFTLPRYNLHSLAAHLRIEPVRLHRALEDARLAKEIFFSIYKRCQSRGADSLGDFIALYGIKNAFFYKNQEAKIDRIRNHIAQDTTLTMRYISQSGCARTLAVMPKEIVRRDQTVMLIAENPHSHKTYTFALSRIVEIREEA